MQARVKEKAAVATPAAEAAARMAQANPNPDDSAGEWAVEAAARMAKAEGSAGGTMATMTAASRGGDGDGEDGQQKDGGDGEGGQRANDGDGEGGQPGGRWDQHMTTTETTTTAATTATTTTTTTMKTTTTTAKARGNKSRNVH